jgi:hypothetical protein
VPRFPLPPPEPPASERWASLEFEAELRTWVEATLGPVRLEQFKLRGWATVVKVYAGGGLFWAKQNCALNAFEATLLDELSRLVPDRVVPLAAVDRERGMLLMPDQGAVYGMEHDDLGSWCQVVQQWAQVQRELLPHTDRLAAAGVVTLRPEDSEDLVTERVAALNALAADDPRRLPDDAARRNVAELDRLRGSVEVVAALDLPMALNHNDLHGGNVFTESGPVMRFFDLGDAILTEPMAVLLTPLSILADRLACANDDPRLWRVADAMVEVWSDLTPASELRVALPHALRLARLARHEAWLRVTPPMTASELADWGSAASEWLAVVPDRPLLADAADC